MTGRRPDRDESEDLPGSKFMRCGNTVVYFPAQGFMFNLIKTNVMKRFFFFVIPGLLCLGCEKVAKSGDDVSDGSGSREQNSTLFVLNEGGYGQGNSSLSVYDVGSGVLTDNAFPGPDVSLDGIQSMTVVGDTGWLAVTTTGCVIRLDLPTMQETGRISGLDGGPRHVHIVSDTKGYVSQLNSGNIVIFNPSTCEKTGEIKTSCPSVEMFLAPASGNTVYANSWSYGNSILRIDTSSDTVTEDVLEIGAQPESMAFDSDGALWVLTDGGWNADYTAKLEKPALHKVDTDTFSEVLELEFGEWDSVSNLFASPEGNRLYYLKNGALYEIPADASALLAEPKIASDGQSFYAAAVSPDGSEFFVSDAVDYSSPGKLLRYSDSGELLGTYDTGVAPGGFCWY